MTRRPQPILTPLTPAAIFLVVTVDDGGEETVHNAFADLAGLVRAVGFRNPAAHLTLVTGIAPAPRLHRERACLRTTRREISTIGARSRGLPAPFRRVYAVSTESNAE